MVKGKIALAEHDSEAVEAFFMAAPGIGRAKHRVLYCIVDIIGVKSPLLISGPAH